MEGHGRGAPRLNGGEGHRGTSRSADDRREEGGPACRSIGGGGASGSEHARGSRCCAAGYEAQLVSRLASEGPLEPPRSLRGAFCDTHRAHQTGKVRSPDALDERPTRCRGVVPEISRQGPEFWGEETLVSG